MMISKKLIPVAIPIVALLLLVASIATLGAKPKTAVRIPPGLIVDSPNAQMANDTPRKPVPTAPNLPPATQPGALTETFDGGALDSWRGLTDANIQWIAKDGRLQQNLPLEETPSEQVALFVTKDTSFSSGSVESYFYPTGGTPLGIVLRGSDAGYYRVTLYLNQPNDKPKALIERVTSNKIETVATAPVTTYPGYGLEQWQLLKVDASGSDISVSVDGHQIISATDANPTGANFAQGWAGVWTLADQSTQFDNVRIQRIAGR